MKKRSKSALKKLLWKHFATFVKNRDKWTCVTCGKQATGQGMNAGHYIAKAACGNEYYFSEKNVHAQCAYCNLALEGNRPKYREYILRTHGEAILHDLETNYRKPAPDYPFEAKIEEYKQKSSQVSV